MKEANLWCKTKRKFKVTIDSKHESQKELLEQCSGRKFFHSLKMEQIHPHNYVTRDDAKQAIFDYIEVFYNRQRLHFANDYLSPVDYKKIKQSVQGGVLKSVDTPQKTGEIIL